MKRAIVALATFALLTLSGCDDIALRDTIVDLVTRASGSVPEAPSGLSAGSLSVSRIHLSWNDNSSNETGFRIERSPDGSSGWMEVSLASADAASWDDTGLIIGTAYSYRVRSYDLAAGDSTYSNTASASTYANVMITINASSDSFTMGDGTYGPGVVQTISDSFKVSRYEITNTEFAGFIADSGYSTSSYWTTNGWTEKTSGSWTQPYFWSNGNLSGANQPVVGVSWYEAVAYCNWRSARESLTAAYNAAGQAAPNATGYRLPTEVQWEYAAAKGASLQTERTYAWGSTWDSSLAVCSVSPASASQTAEVGSKSTAGDTPQGLADISGNVWEWCSDNYQSDAGITAGTDWYYFIGDSTAQYMVHRGGAWDYANEDGLRCACRSYWIPSLRDHILGFRVLRP
jgi:formylglycine-generating enzyme required for sulfatase activity